MLILPNNPLYQLTLEFAWQFLHGMKGNQYYVKGADGLMRMATSEEVTEYLEGGECDEVEAMEGGFEYEWMG
jgi:hypothetical protein